MKGAWNLLRLASWYAKWALILTACFWAALILVDLIPQPIMMENVGRSAKAFDLEGLYPRARTTGLALDDFTEVIMVSESSRKDSNPVIDVLEAKYCGMDDAFNGRETVSDVVIRSARGEQDVQYSRYWHGYVTLLRPLLFVLDIYGIRRLFQLAALSALALVAARFGTVYGIEGGVIATLFALSLALVGLPDATATLPTSFSFFIAIVGSYLVLGDRFSNFNSIAHLFFFLGALDVYYDFLDNPILTLAIPLACVLLRRALDVAKEGRGVARLLLCCCLSWLVGYAGLWLIKWLLCLMLLGPSSLEDALSAASYRAGQGVGTTGISGRLEAIAANYRALGPARVTARLLPLVCLASIVVEGMRSRRLNRAALPYEIALVVTSGMPLVWFLVLSNHSIEHAEFIAYRNFAAYFFPLLVCAVLPWFRQVRAECQVRDRCPSNGGGDGQNV